MSPITCTATHMEITLQMQWHLTQKVIDFNSMFSSVVIPKILIKYPLHTSHDSLDHIGATKLSFH